MKPKGAAKHFVLAFVLALAGYIAFYQLIEHRRVRNGPWEITFATTNANAPMLLINQPKLGITNLALTFPGEAVPAANLPVTLSFAQPKPVPFDLPFGKCIFMDSTFLPGTLTLELFQHEIELLPRVLVIDRQEHPWRSRSPIVLPKTQDQRPVQ